VIDSSVVLLCRNRRRQRNELANQRKNQAETRSYHNLYDIIEREREREREIGTRVHEI